MTYCFGFRVKGDGVGIVFDTRATSRETGMPLAGLFQKVEPVDRSAMIAGAGSVEAIQQLLSGVFDGLRGGPPHTRGARFTEIVAANLRQARPVELDGTTLMMAHCYRGPGRLRTQVVVASAAWTPEGYRLDTIPNYNYVGIGWRDPGRRALTQAGMIVDRVLRTGVVKIDPSLSPPAEVGDPTRFMPGLTIEFGPKEHNKFLPQLAAMLRRPDPRQFRQRSCTAFLGFIALGGIAWRMGELRAMGEPLAETVGDSWGLATITAHQGFLLHGDDATRRAAESFGFLRPLMRTW